MPGCAGRLIGRHSGRLFVAALLACSLLLASAARAADADADTALKNAVSTYQTDLARQMVFHKRYPPEAQEQKLQGTTLLHVGIGTQGELAHLAIEKSSGHPQLDEAALLAARKAKAQTLIPANLQGKQFSAHVQVSFELENRPLQRSP